MTPAEAIGHALEALDFAEDAVRNYTQYPSYEYQAHRLDQVKEAKKVLRKLKAVL